MADVAQTFALNPYSAEQAKIERLQKYAELLQSQGLAPEQKFGYAGIEAPPSAAGALAKGLQLGVSGYLQGRGMRKTDELTEKARAESKEFIDTLTGKPGEVAPTRGLGISDFEDRQVVGGKYDPEAGPQKLATTLSGNIPVAPGQGDVVPGLAPLAGAERTAALLRGAVSANPMIAPLASSLYAKDIEPPKLEKLGEDESGLIYNKDTKKFEPLSGAGPKKPYMGKDLNAQDRNILLTGDPSSPEYAASYAAMATPKTIKDDQGQVYQINPDMTPYKPPRGAIPGGSPIPGSGAGTPIRTAAPPPGAQAVNVPNAKPTPLTEGQGNAATFSERMAQADKILADTQSAGLNPTNHFLAGVPGVGNYLVSPEYQRYDQASRNFINATLRRESGASISPDEFDNARKQYLPQPGDSEKVLADKAQNRKTAVDGMVRSAGPSFTPAPVKGPPSSEFTPEQIQAELKRRGLVK